VTSRAFLTNAATRRAVFLQRYIRRQNEVAAAQLRLYKGQLSARLLQDEYASKDLTRLIADMRTLQILDQKALIAEAEKLAISEAGFTADMLTAGTSAIFAVPTSTLLATAISAAVPVQAGVSIPELLSAFGTKKASDILNVIMDGATSGSPTTSIVKKVSGFIDSLISRQVQALVATVLSHASSAGRLATYEQNSDLVNEYQWVSTLDGLTSMICMGRDGNKYDVGIGPMPPAHYNCVISGTFITSAAGVSAISKRVFEGKVITIKTVSGNVITVTPKHPVLTAKGWMSAELVNVGDQCFNQSRCKGIGVIDGDDNRGFHRVEDIFKSLWCSGDVKAREVVISAPDFHGDGIDNEIAEIRSASNLAGTCDIGIVQHFGESILKRRNMMDIDSARERLSQLALSGKCSDATSGGNVRISHQSTLFSGSSFVHPSLLLGTTATKNNAILTNDSLNGSWADTEFIGDSPNTYAGGVFADDVISVEVSDFIGHVYNLQTFDHCFAANGIITHNCRSTTIPVVRQEFSLDVKGQRPAIGADGTEVVSSNTRYSTWLRSQPKSFIDEALGPARSKLFRDGTFTLDRFTDPTGKQYTLSQLDSMNNIALSAE